jgi:hypothetical protein
LALATPGGLLAQTCNDFIPATAPDSRYTAPGDGTVTDSQTGLMWKQCSEGQSGADCGDGWVTGHTWREALQQAEASSFAGYSDWRLPNIKELSSLVERRCNSPAISIDYFPNTASLYYWSSSPGAYRSSHAWYVNFCYGYGGGYLKNYERAVRLVRGRQ